MRKYQFEWSVRVDDSHLDDLNHVNNAVYIQWMQEVAAAHWVEKTGGTQSESFYWVVSEHQIQYKKQVFLNETLVLKTYLEKVEGLRLPRVIDFYREKELVATAKTYWVKVDKQSQRPLRITNEFL